MMESTEFTNLKTNILVIDSEFRNFRQEEASNPENQRRLRACISLIHSELEVYFELIGDKIANSYPTKMSKKQRRKFCKFITLYSFQSYDGQEHNVHERTLNCLTVYKNILQQNNGIKSKDILKILLPVGIPLLEIDTTWLASINSFGGMRGSLIHKNINQINRLVGYQYIDEIVHRIILPGIKKLDEYILNNFPIRD